MARKRTLLKTLAKILVALCLIVAVGVAAALYVMNGKDKEHARFFNTGKAVNTFLGNYSKAVREGVEKKNPATVAALYSNAYASQGRGRWVMQPDGEQSDVAVSKVVAEGRQDFTKADIPEEVSRYFNTLASVQNIWTKIDMIEQIEPERRVTLRVKFILDGTGRQGEIFEDRHFYRWTLVNESSAAGEINWKITNDELIEGLRVAGDGGGYKDVNPASAGIDFKHSRDPKLDAEKYSAKMKFDIIEHGSGGVSAADYNNDDRPDIFFPDGVRSRLYKNVGDTATGEVRFADATSESGLEGIDQSNAGLFADVDNDGFPDLFVARYLAPNKFFHNNGDGTFTDRSKEMGLDLNSTSVTACFFDYDRDGFVDVASADYDGDGFPDLAVANDFGRKCLFHNNGDGTFTDAAKQAGVLDFSGGMGLAFGDFNDDGKFDLYTSNINSNQRWFGEDMTVSQYVRNVARTKWLLLDMPEYKKFYDLVGSDWVSIGKKIGAGNSLFRNRGDGTFATIEDSHTNRAGWGWSTTFLDMDNDTDLDIYAANGWITNKSKDDL
ncbi:MAG: VCBS repeat-containing protein [Acidobacteria bacterium]|nr:VCBS repeat-containing protein [Acidobacteriota bacterium]